jgi:hypothetical protein
MQDIRLLRAPRRCTASSSGDGAENFRVAGSPVMLSQQCPETQRAGRNAGGGHDLRLTVRHRTGRSNPR